PPPAGVYAVTHGHRTIFGCPHKPSMIAAVAVLMPTPRPTLKPSDVGVLTQMLRRWHEIKDPLAWASKGLLSNLIKYRQSEQRRMIRQCKYLADTFERPNDHADIWDDADAVDQLLAVLTPNQRAVVKHMLRGLSQEQVALLLGKSYDAVRRSLSDIRRRLESHRQHQVETMIWPTQVRPR
ncbi:sigma-70 family RNA polymerase sigma factor, partial [Polymorphospora sp. NPDC050346]|uniref:sigma-70 family RNA polymerase sigma factor n=1 Tax=Polymorphospora sp. NPDC050346 TaxID=3155780 RepID=UPI0033FD84E1